MGPTVEIPPVKNCSDLAMFVCGKGNGLEEGMEKKKGGGHKSGKNRQQDPLSLFLAQKLDLLCDQSVTGLGSHPSLSFLSSFLLPAILIR